MKQKMVVTNLRLPESDWLQVKVAASELGMSVNEYIKFSTQFVAANRQLYSEPKKLKGSYEKIWDIIKTKNKQRPMGWSKEDEEIYSV